MGALGWISVLNGDWWRYFGFVQNLSVETVLGGIRPAWSLCVEMSFYLVLPIWALGIARLLRGRPARTQIRAEAIALGALALASLALRAAFFDADHSSLWLVTLPAFLDWFAVGMGLALASVALAGREPRAAVLRRPWLAWAGAAACFAVVSLVVPLPRGLVAARTVEAALLAQHVLYIAVGALVALPGIFGIRPDAEPPPAQSTLLGHPVMAWLGLVSYGIFLWHQPLLDQLLIQDLRRPRAGAPVRHRAGRDDGRRGRDRRGELLPRRAPVPRAQGPRAPRGAGSGAGPPHRGLSARARAAARRAAAGSARRSAASSAAQAENTSGPRRVASRASARASALRPATSRLDGPGREVVDVVAVRAHRARVGRERPRRHRSAARRGEHRPARVLAAVLVGEPSREHGDRRDAHGEDARAQRHGGQPTLAARAWSPRRHRPLEALRRDPRAARRRPRRRRGRARRAARAERRRQVDAREDRVRPRPADRRHRRGLRRARRARPRPAARSATWPSCSASPAGRAPTSCSTLHQRLAGSERRRGRARRAARARRPDRGARPPHRDDVEGHAAAARDRAGARRRARRCCCSTSRRARSTRPGAGPCAGCSSSCAAAASPCC